MADRLKCFPRNFEKLKRTKTLSPVFLTAYCVNKLNSIKTRLTILRHRDTNKGRRMFLLSFLLQHTAERNNFGSFCSIDGAKQKPKMSRLHFCFQRNNFFFILRSLKNFTRIFFFILSTLWSTRLPHLRGRWFKSSCH